MVEIEEVQVDPSSMNTDADDDWEKLMEDDLVLKVNQLFGINVN